MLVLTRRTGQRIILDGGNVTGTITVVSLKNGQVRIGLEFPSQVHIVREELKPIIQAGEPCKP